MKIEVPFANYEGASVVEQNSREMLLNMFAEIEISGRKKLIRRQRPGVAVSLANSGEKRCIERHKGVHYAVIGNILYRYQGGTLTELGKIGSATGRCTMIFNDNDQIMVSDGTNAWYYNGTTVQAVTSDVHIGHLDYISGYGLFNRPETGQFYVTPLNDFSTIDALDFASAESYPDFLVRPFVDHNEVWLFGAVSTEIWQQSGGADFPFSRYQIIERGIMAPYSVVAEDNTVFWLGDDGVFYRADGYRPVRFSTHPVERAVQEVSDEARRNADAFVYTLGGHKFYTIRFPGELTLQFNIATNFWNRAGSYGHNDWRIMGSAGHHSEYFMTPTAIATLQSGLSTDEGGILERGGVSAPGYAEGNNISVRSLFIDAEVGRAPIGEEARIMLRVARDGETFGNERWRSLGSTGDYRRRAMWRNLGLGRKWVYEIMFTDEAEFSVIAAHADMVVASS